MFVLTSRGLIKAADIRRIDVESEWSSSQNAALWKVIVTAPGVLALGATYGGKHSSEKLARDRAMALAERLSGQKVIV